MKNLKLIAIAIVSVVFLNATAVASNPPKPAAEINASLHNALEDVMDYPSNIDEDIPSTSVWVTFDVKEDGTLDAKSVQGEKAFVEHVKKELKNVQATNPYLHGKTYIIKIVFNKEMR